MHYVRFIFAMLCLAGLATRLAIRPPSLSSAEIADQTVLVDFMLSVGTAVLVPSTYGPTYALTAAHVLSASELPTLILRNGEQYKAEVVAISPAQDLALLKVIGNLPLQCRRFAFAPEAEVFDEILLVGSAFGGSFPGYAVRGQVTMTQAKPEIFGWPWKFPVFCTDAAGERGMSGCGGWIGGRYAGMFVGMVNDVRALVPASEIRLFLDSHVIAPLDIER
jgi:S1-C subfamily serine protease